MRVHIVNLGYSLCGLTIRKITEKSDQWVGSEDWDDVPLEQRCVDCAIKEQRSMDDTKAILAGDQVLLSLHVLDLYGEGEGPLTTQDAKRMAVTFRMALGDEEYKKRYPVYIIEYADVHPVNGPTLHRQGQGSWPEWLQPLIGWAVPDERNLPDAIITTGKGPVIMDFKTAADRAEPVIDEIVKKFRDSSRQPWRTYVIPFIVGIGLGVFATWLI